jgi:hypothetical protein
VNSSKFLCIEFNEPDVYFSKLPKWKRIVLATNTKLGFGDLSIGFTGLSPGIEEAWQFIEQLHAHPERVTSPMRDL